MIDIAAEHGYAAATIARVIVRAGVSRPSFYEHFADKEECFLAALTDVQERLLDEVTLVVRGQPPERAIGGAVEALIELADSQAATARFLMNETLAGGSRTLDARDRGIEEIARVIEQAHEQLGADAVLPDLPVAALLGAVQRLLAARLRRGEQTPAGMLEDLLEWTRSYEQPAGEHRRRTLTPIEPGARSPFLAKVPLQPPPPLAPGRPRLSQQQVAENHSLRILFATAELIGREGYAAATVAAIAELAGVDGRVFYRLFADKQSAFTAVNELAFQRTMAVTVGAFFAAEDWPEQIWEAGRAFLQFIEQNPVLTRASLIEGHADGPATVERFEHLLNAFTIFLQEGYKHAPRERAPSRIALEAITATVFEIVQHQARKDGAETRVAGLLAHLCFICLAPFLGPRRTNELIDERIEAERAPRVT